MLIDKLVKDTIEAVCDKIEKVVYSEYRKAKADSDTYLEKAEIALDKLQEVLDALRKQST